MGHSRAKVVYRIRVHCVRVATPVAIAAVFLLGGRALAGQDPDTVPAARGDTLPAHRAQEITVRVARSLEIIGRLPFAVSTADADALQAAERTVSLDEALRFVPGLFVQNRRNFSLGDRITMRGLGGRAQFGVRGVRVLADGIPLTLADGQSTITNLDVSSGGRVEVIRGPASALYGNASGGVISVRTQFPSAEPLLVEPLFLGGTHGFFQGRLKASGTSGGFSWLGNVSYLNTDGFREHSKAEILRANVTLAAPVGASGEIRGVLSFYDTPFSENPSSLTLEDATRRPRMARSFIIAQGSGEDATQGQAGATLDLPLGEGGRFQATAWGLWRDLWNPIPGRIISIDRRAEGIRTEAGGTLGPRARWLAGFDLERQRDDRTELVNEGVPEGDPDGRAREGARILDQRERVLGIAPFVRLALDLGERVTITLAGRFDLFDFDAVDRFLDDGNDSGDRTLTQFSPSAGITLAAADGLRLYGNFSTAFQTPTTNELSNRPDGSGGFNPDLDPERILGGEIGVRGTLQGVRLGYEVAAFLTRVEDALIPFEGPTEEAFFRNAGRVERRGLEVALGWEPTPAWRGEIAYTVQRLRFEEFEVGGVDLAGNDEPGVPSGWLAVGLTHTAGFGLRSEANFRWVDAYPVDDANTAVNPSYRVVDLRFSLDRTAEGWPLRLFAGLDNLFDERYNGSVVPNAFGRRFYEPAPGVELYGGVSWPIGARRGGAP